MRSLNLLTKKMHGVDQTCFFSQHMFSPHTFILQTRNLHPYSVVTRQQEEGVVGE